MERMPGVALGVLVVLGNPLFLGAAAMSPLSDQSYPPVDLIVVPEEEPWLLAVACPLVNRLARGDHRPLLLAAAARSQPEERLLVEQIRPQGTLVLDWPPGPEVARGLARAAADVLPWACAPWEASLRVAKRFWGVSRTVVVASLADPESAILAAALAAERSVPLVLLGKEPKQTPEDALVQGLVELQVERMVIASGRSKQAPAWARRVAAKVEVLDCQAIEDWLVEALRPGQVRNVILARVPGENGKTGRTAWLAPYLGLARRAPVVLCRSPGAVEAEARVHEFLRRHALTPHTLTILADYHAIGTSTVVLEKGSDPSGPEGEVAIEPCMPRGLERTASLGVGRIPLAAVADASAFLARGLVRHAVLGRQRPRMVMVANPVQDRKPLPLCEVVSRLTASEFENFRVQSEEFYHQPADSPEVIAAARTANLIIYEGHIEHQELFKPRRRGGGFAPLAGLPVVVLQSCDSLKRDVLREIHESGGVALIGSSTPVHSTSGSAFIKALSDGVLYRDLTLGEAVRDAWNYFLCLQDLKNARGHRQQAKSRRVAMSFRLWGDPELRLFAQGLGEPELRPVAARWDGPGRLVVSQPAATLPVERSEKYEARVFPGSEAAGMVRRVEGESARRLTPLYFFRMSLPDGLAAAGDSWTVEGSGSERPRAVVRTDPAGRSLYVLYYPSAQRPGETLTLQVVKEVGRATK